MSRAPRTRAIAAIDPSTCYPIENMEERFRRFVTSARALIRCDAVALLRLEDGVLVPLIVDGLRAEAIARRFVPLEHPRLARLLAAPGPVRFGDDGTPDPFDGLFAHDEDLRSRAHACMGSPVHVDGVLVGVLTLDALAPQAFDDVHDETVATLAALAGASIHAAALSDALERVAAGTQLVARQLVREALERSDGELLGTSTAMAQVRTEISLLARSDLTALITGETGVGKELVARAIHARSRRAAKPMIHVNCAALPEALAESELFGHTRGSFTGAVDHRAGKFEIADGGTLLLDEVGELPLSIQAKLLRVLQSGEVQRVGVDRSLRVDVRVIAATNRDLAEEVRAGRFRGDLFYRLSVYPLRIPPLRERLDDVPLLSGHFLELARSRLGLGPLRLSVAARNRLRTHGWPGNVRELEHALLRGALRASEGRPEETIVIDTVHLGLAETPSTPPVDAVPTPQPLREAVDAFTSQLIANTIAACGDNWAEAARRLGLQRGNLHRLAARLGLHARS